MKRIRIILETLQNIKLAYSLATPLMKCNMLPIDQRQKILKDVLAVL